jgi:Domain of unknown function (DUF5069)
MVSESTIGLQPDLVGPSFTLALRAIHNVTPALGNAAHMIYTGKMANERLMALALDLTRVAPRSPRAPLGIFSVIAGRALDKCRAELAGRAGSYRYNCSLDRAFFDFTGIDSAEFKQFVATGASDQEVATWIAEKSRVHDHRKIARWSRRFRFNPLNWVLDFDDWLHVRRNT